MISFNHTHNAIIGGLSSISIYMPTRYASGALVETRRAFRSPRGPAFSSVRLGREVILCLLYLSRLCEAVGRRTLPKTNNEKVKIINYFFYKKLNMLRTRREK